MSLRLLPQRYFIWALLFHVSTQLKDHGSIAIITGSLTASYSRRWCFSDIRVHSCHAEIHESAQDHSSSKWPFCFSVIFNIVGKMNMWVITQSGKHLYWLDTVMAVFTHRRPLPSAPLATGAEAGWGLRRAGQVGTVWLLSHSSLGISAADITRPLPLATGHWAL